MIRKILHIAFLTGAVAGLLVLLGLTSGHNLQHRGSGLQVVVDRGCGNHFLEGEAIRKLVAGRLPGIDEEPAVEGRLKTVKQLVEGLPHVKRAAIYRTVNGDLRIEVSQRDPLIRVASGNGQGYYIDREGITMPLSSNFTARVMVAGGSIMTSYTQPVDLAENKPAGQIMPAEQKLRNLFQLASYIDSHPFWRSLIDQINVTPSGQFELMPMNGAHVIEFGGTDNMEEKFEKLALFYRAGINKVGWNHYSRINLKYDKQVVCSR